MESDSINENRIGNGGISARGNGRLTAPLACIASAEISTATRPIPGQAMGAVR